MYRGKVIFVPLEGIISIEKVHEFQEKIISKYTQNQINIIYSPNIEPSFSFGERDSKNSFKPEISKSLNSKKSISQIQGLPFRESKRGGGSSYFSPEQAILFFNLNLNQEYNLNNFYEDLTLSLIESIGQLIQTQKDLNFQTNEEETLFTINGDSRKYKISSLGINFKKDITKYGISIYPSIESISGFDYVNPCGITPEVAQITSLESLDSLVKKEIIFETLLTRFFQNSKFKYTKNPVIENEVQNLYNQFSEDNS